ncbi:MAG: hypothetical protein NTY01_24470, partial [Verrucomicrobia bacterium]|nr:hypothetical protein [Verrucomicrobiota bacterium]
PPSVVVADESLPRRLVKLEREEAELPSRHLEQALHEEELPSVHREETARETTPPSAQPPVAAPARAPVIGLRASVYRAQLCSRADARHAIVLRELLGPPLALRQDW